MWYIYKYLMPRLGEELELLVPSKMHVCDFHVQGNDAFMWAVVDTTSPLVKRKIIAIGTGWPIENPDDMQFLKTVHWPDGCVWHYLAGHDSKGSPITEIILNASNSDITHTLIEDTSDVA
jgi:hypothetical protein